MSTPSAGQTGGSDRPAVMNNPLRSVRPLRRLEFVRSRPPVVADIALVLVAADGRASTYGAELQPTRGELVAKNFRTLYEVDLADHHQFFQYQLPSQGDAFFFQTEVDVHWHVIQPETVVRRQVRDVRTAIESPLRMLMTEKTRQFAIEDNAMAESAVNKALEEARIGEEFGLHVTCRVRLALDDDAREHLKVLRLDTYKLVQLAGKHGIEKATATNEQELLQARVVFYNGLMQQDDNMWALILARNPNDVPLVIEGRRADELEAMATRMEVFQKLLDSGRVEDHLLEEPIKMVISTVKEALAKAADGSTARRPLYKEQLPAAEPKAQVEPAPDADDAK